MYKSKISKLKKASILLYIAAGSFLVAFILLVIGSGFSFTWNIVTDFINLFYEGFSFGIIRVSIVFFVIGLVAYGVSDLCLANTFKIKLENKNELSTEIKNFSTMTTGAGVATIITAFVILFPIGIFYAAYITPIYLFLVPLTAIGINLVIYFQINNIPKKLNISFKEFGKLHSENYTYCGLVKLVGLVGFGIYPLIGGLLFVFMFILNGIQFRRTSLVMENYSEIVIKKEVEERKTPTIQNHAPKPVLNQGISDFIPSEKVIEQQKSSVLNYCLNCGKKLETTMRFCSNCGKTLE